MKIAYIILSSLLILAIFTGCATSDDPLKPISSIGPTVSKEGTLANHVLAQDTSLAIRQMMGGMNKEIIKFVMQKPVGKPGMKAWREMWTFDPGGIHKDFIITFREDGQGSANFEIQPL